MSKTRRFSTIRPSKEKTVRDALCDARPSKCMISLKNLFLYVLVSVFSGSLARHLASSHSMASRIARVSEILLGHGFQIARHMTRSRKIYQKSTCFWWFNLKSYFWKANAAKRLFWCPRPWGGESSKSLVFLIHLRCSWLCVCPNSMMWAPEVKKSRVFDKTNRLH